MRYYSLVITFIFLAISIQAQEIIRFDLNGLEKFKFESDSIGRSRIVLNNNLNNFAVGNNALKANTTGENNIANGINALRRNTEGINNIANGSGALAFNTTGNDNIANGSEALKTNTTGSNNIANGYLSLQKNTTGNNNIANGFQTLRNNTGGENNIANGSGALLKNTTGNNNIANGLQALFFNTTGNDNIANGYLSLQKNTTGNDNIANGYLSLRNNTTGNNNIAFGYEALVSNTTFGENIAMGHSSLKNTNAISNIGIGGKTLENNVGGSDNIAIGYAALNSNINSSNNVAIGHEAGNSTTGGGNIFLGTNAGKNETGSNKLYINNNDGNSSSALIYGDFTSDDLRFNAEVGIGRASVGFPLTIEADSDGDIMQIYDDANTAHWHLKLDANGNLGYTETSIADNRFRLRKGGNAGFNQSYSDVALTVKSGGGNAKLLVLESSGGTERFHVTANGNATLAGTLTENSDKRLKKDIVQVTSALAGVQQLAGYRYNWIAKDRSQDTQIGVIAQEVQAIYPELVRTDEKGILSVNYSGLAPILIEAMKEQQTIIDEQEARMAKMMVRLTQMEAALQNILSANNESNDVAASKE